MLLGGAADERAPSASGVVQPGAHRQENWGPGRGQPGDGRRLGCGQPFPDPLQAVRRRLHRLGRRAQFPAQNLLVLALARRHLSRSSTPRRAAMPRAVWLLTALRLMPMAEAISYSARSA